MAYTILSNKKNTSATLHINSNSTIIIAGNNSVSNVAIGTEVLSGASISQIAWGCDPNGSIQISRGANLVGVYDSTSYIDYAGNGIALDIHPSANLVVTFIGSANCSCVIEIQKKIANTTTEYLVN